MKLLTKLCNLIWLMLVMAGLNNVTVIAQTALPHYTELPALPDKQGFAGMFAGVSHDALICFGGANFPDKFPWENGIKKWYKDVYILEKGGKWLKLTDKLTQPIGYGVSISYQNKVIMVGGSNQDGHHATVTAYEWINRDLKATPYPALPYSLAYMTGTLLNDCILIAGGLETASSAPLRKVLLLDLKNLTQGWTEIEAWPGDERHSAVCGVYQNELYLFGGENVKVNSLGTNYRNILTDGFKLKLSGSEKGWLAKWTPLASMPRGASAAAALMPLLNNTHFLIWGGVDGNAAQYRHAPTHPGFTKSLLYYFPETDSWEYPGDQSAIAPRVTLPVTFWNNQWIYVSGEIGPGIRTPLITGVQ